MHQPFDTVMEKSGVETRSSEQTMLSDAAHVFLVTDNSSEEDPETDDQSYSPLPPLQTIIRRKITVQGGFRGSRPLISFTP